MKISLLAASILLALASILPAQETQTITLTDDGRALLNPQMGWTCHFYSNVVSNYGSRLEPSDSLDWFEGCSTVYLRLPWAYIEPEEGVFNWAIVDTPAQRWIAAGKKVAFRFTTSENWMEYATPKWVFDAGAESIRYTWGKGPDPNGPAVDPVFDDPIYLEKLDNFLAAAGKRYNNNPNVAFIDVGTYGMWGEGHSSLGVWDKAKFSRMTPEQTLRSSRRISTCTASISRKRSYASATTSPDPKSPGSISRRPTTRSRKASPCATTASWSPRNRTRGSMPIWRKSSGRPCPSFLNTSTSSRLKSAAHGTMRS